jgi:hypothetical protein
LRNPYPDFFNLDCDRYGPASRGPLPHKATARRFRSRAGQLRPRAGDKATQLRRHAFGGQFFACLADFAPLSCMPRSTCGGFENWMSA